MWIDQQLVRNVEDPIEKPLLGHFKLAYMSGKGTKYLVPVLISLDVISGINKLVELRDDVGVNSDNPYLFANTQGSLKPVSGWQCVNEVCGSPRPHKVNSNCNEASGFHSVCLRWL